MFPIEKFLIANIKKRKISIHSNHQIFIYLQFENISSTEADA